MTGTGDLSPTIWETDPSPSERPVVTLFVWTVLLMKPIGFGRVMTLPYGYLGVFRAVWGTDSSTPLHSA